MYLSKLCPSLLLFHSPVSHQVIKHLTWKEQQLILDRRQDNRLGESAGMHLALPPWGLEWGYEQGLTGKGILNTPITYYC